MASVLQVIGAIEGIANAAVDITRIVTHQLGIPRELVADLSNAEEVSHRVLVREGSHLARRPLAALELPTATGMRVMAIRRGRDWITDVEGEDSSCPATCCSCGARRPASCGCASWRPHRSGSRRSRPRTASLTDLDRAVDVLVEMKNISEVAVGPRLLRAGAPRRRAWPPRSATSRTASTR